MVALPFLTSYDPSASSEGTLDPLGLYQIADQLAVQLVPAVRERMQRIRFLTAMAVGALVTEGLDDNPEGRDASPYLVWEWLVVEALMRTKGEDPGLWGIPGTLVARRALNQHGYLDARSYLKTPRIFGFHGVYKRLAIHLRLVDVHLNVAPNTEKLVDAWARSIGLRDLNDAKSLLSRWTIEVKRCLRERPPRTRPNLSSNGWKELADAFAPHLCRWQERDYLRHLLLDQPERRLGILPILWQLLSESKEDMPEERLHNLLEAREPSCAPQLHAIRTYEAFARALQDAFDLLRAQATTLDARGFEITDIARDPDFKQCVKHLHERFANALRALSEVSVTNLSLQNLFADRFGVFAEPLDAGACALTLCSHHEGIQKAKSAAGKLPWFDRLDQRRIYIRHAYREKRREIQPDRYLHDYRSRPISNFFNDLNDQT
jgi:hypothetical protein